MLFQGTTCHVAENVKRVGILGGSFDPVHFGHIKPALELVRVNRLDKVILLPCKLSPFKQKTHISVAHRWKMLQMVAAQVPQFVADPRELTRDTPSYSYLSVQEISAELGDKCKLFWILGADALVDFPRWYRVDDMMKLCSVLVLSRPGYEIKHNEWLQQHITNDNEQFEQHYPGSILVTNTQQYEVSSSKIRSIIQSGQQPKYMLPGGIWNYIKRNQLYADVVEDINL